MHIEEAKKIFLDVLESMPGIRKIILSSEEILEQKNLPVLKVEENINGFVFIATLVVILGTNVKELISQIGEALRYRMKMQNAKVNKLNIFIEGIEND
ncbi:hypothetical protein ACJA27_03560 [Mycoplasmopsis lipophila]|uniref:hypothetical protein n=1 Tax=Mycoplasmopsis lipophila TaxID=2117 RepID=UPI003872BA4E